MREQKEIFFRVLVQLGAFLEKDRAEKFKESLDSQGRLAYIRSVAVNSKTFYKVLEQVGSYSQVDKANQHAEKLKRMGKPAFVEKGEIVRQVPELKGKVIVLDPGHGGSDPGATGPKGSKEKDVNLQVALLAKQLLLQEGASVRLTRESDTFIGLPERPALANSLRAHVFLSIHMNGATSPLANGTEVIYRQNPHCYELAVLIQKHFRELLGLNDRGSKLDSRGLAVLRRAKVPAALIEMAFITNPKEEALFSSDAARQKAAQAIYRACLEFLRNR